MSSQSHETGQTPYGIACVKLLFHYIAAVCEGLRFSSFREQIQQSLPQAEWILMTMAEELMQRGQVTLLVRQLNTKFGDLPAEYQARLETATSELLERYAVRVLGAGTLAAVFDED